MSFLARMGAAIGVGNLTVTVECDDAAHEGELIRGVATITGGNVAQRVEGLEVAIVHLWEVYDHESQRTEQRSKTRHRRQMELRGDVLPGSTQSVPFMIDVPVGIPLAEGGEWYSVGVEAKIASAIDVSGHRTVRLWPIRPVADTLRALTAATGWRLAGFQPRKASAGFVRAVLTPGPAHAARFDRLNLELALDRGALRVHANLDMKEGIWKTLTGGDEHDYAFAVNDLPSAVAAIQGLLYKHASGG